jgi:hypothetical protein
MAADTSLKYFDRLEENRYDKLLIQRRASPPLSLLCRGPPGSRANQPVSLLFGHYTTFPVVCGNPGTRETAERSGIEQREARSHEATKEGYSVKDVGKPLAPSPGRNIRPKME